MNALWLENGHLTLRDDFPIPSVGPKDALVKTRLAGICGTDIQLVKGYYDFAGIPGHEFVGEVIQCDDQPSLIGKRVVGEINISCGHCNYCQKGQARHCGQRTVLGIRNHNGVFADYFTLPHQNLHIVPDEVDDKDAVFAEPLAAALHILDQVTVDETSQTLIIGAGKLGQIIMSALSRYNPKLAVSYRHPRQKNVIESVNLTAIHEEDIKESQWDIVIEASGSPTGLRTAIHAVKPLGQIVLKSTYHGNSDIDFSRVAVDEIQVIGSRCGDFHPALSFLQRNTPGPSQFIQDIFPFEKALQAFETAQKSGNGKVILSMS